MKQLISINLSDEQYKIKDILEETIDEIVEKLGYSKSDLVKVMSLLSTFLLVDVSNEIDIDEKPEEKHERLLNYAVREIKEFFIKIERINKEIESDDFDQYEIDTLMEAFDELIETFEDDIREVCEDKLKVLKKELKKTINKGNVQYSIRFIKDAHKTKIFNMGSVQSIVFGLERAYDLLKSNDALNDELLSIIHENRVRCAIYRANKKFKEAKIAHEVGNIKRCNKLFLEGKAMLIQDWEEILKDRNFPKVDENKLFSLS